MSFLYKRHGIVSRFGHSFLIWQSPMLIHITLSQESLDHQFHSCHYIFFLMNKECPPPLLCQWNYPIVSLKHSKWMWWSSWWQSFSPNEIFPELGSGFGPTLWSSFIRVNIIQSSLMQQHCMNYEHYFNLFHILVPSIKATILWLAWCGCIRQHKVKNSHFCLQRSWAKGCTVISQ